MAQSDYETFGGGMSKKEWKALYPGDWKDLVDVAYSGPNGGTKENIRNHAEMLGQMAPEEREQYWKDGKNKFTSFEDIVGDPKHTDKYMTQLLNYTKAGYSEEGAKAQIERDFIARRDVRSQADKPSNPLSQVTRWLDDQGLEGVALAAVAIPVLLASAPAIASAFGGAAPGTAAITEAATSMGMTTEAFTAAAATQGVTPTVLAGQVSSAISGGVAGLGGTVGGTVGGGFLNSLGSGLVKGAKWAGSGIASTLKGGGGEGMGLGANLLGTALNVGGSLYGQNQALDAMQDAQAGAEDSMTEGLDKTLAFYQKMYDQIRADNEIPMAVRDKALLDLQSRIEEGPGEFNPATEPGYRFGFNEFIKKPYQQQNFLGGKEGSTAALQGLTRYAMDYGDTKFNEFEQRYYNSLNPLSTAAGLGQTGASNTAQAGMNTGSAMGGAQTNYSNNMAQLGYTSGFDQGNTSLNTTNQITNALSELIMGKQGVG